MNTQVELISEGKAQELAEEIALFVTEDGAYGVERSIAWKTLDEINAEAADLARDVVRLFLTDEIVSDLAERIQDAIRDAQEGGSDDDA